MVKKSTQQRSAHQSFVITVGYTLFVCMVLGLITGTIVPLAQVFSNPHVRIVNVTVFLISLIVSALLPALIAYGVGGASTRSKNLQVHHYNGVLFGLLAYWVNVISSMLNADFMDFFYATLPTPINTAVGFMVPVTVTAIAVGVLAYYYHRSKGKQSDLVEYRPFQLSLIGFVVLYVIALPFQQFVNGYWTSTMAIEVGLLPIAYICLMKMHLSTLQKLTLASIGTTLALITQYIASQFLPDVYSIATNVWSISTITLFLASFMVWALYLYITRLMYRK
jgi:hypothetical protein